MFYTVNSWEGREEAKRGNSRDKGLAMSSKYFVTIECRGEKEERTVLSDTAVGAISLARHKSSLGKDAEMTRTEERSSWSEEVDEVIGEVRAVDVALEEDVRKHFLLEPGAT